jgi:hypothetical protein
LNDVGHVGQNSWCALFGLISRTPIDTAKDILLPPHKPSDKLMSDKKSKKSLKHLAKNALLGIPTSIATGPLGFRTELDVDPKSEYDRLRFSERFDLIRLQH